MKDKLEERYIRTYDGFIRKIKVVSKKNAPLVLFLINNKPYTVDDIKKASYNIIDIIEVEDYVNGYKITSIYDDDSEVNEYNLKHKKCLGKNIYDEDYQEYLIYAEDIKSIVTKEMFSSMEYRLGDDE